MKYGKADRRVFGKVLNDSRSEAWLYFFTAGRLSIIWEKKR